MASFCERLTALENRADSDNQNLNVNCATGQLEITGGSGVDLVSLRGGTRLVWSIAGTRGFTFESWTGADASGVANPNNDEDGFDAAWAGAPADGVPTHVLGAAPTVSGVETDTRFGQPEQGQDEHRLCYWLYNDRPVPIEIQDSDARAESLRVYAGCDCPSSLIYEHYQSEGQPYDSDGLPIQTLAPGQLVKWTVLIHDPGPDFSGFQPRANEIGDPTLFEPTSYQERPSVVCDLVVDTACDPYVLGEGESFKPLTMDCVDCGTATAAEPATPVAQEITAELKPCYEYRDIWAEEGGGLATNSSQWSFGNGATGFIGIPIDGGWEVVAMGFHADFAGANDDVTVHLVDFQGTTPSVVSPVVSTVTVTNAGDGAANNAHIYQDFSTAPLPVPAGAVLGFRTGTESGAFTDARVYARLRRQTGECVARIFVNGEPVTITDGDDGPPDLGEPAGSALVSDNCQDGGGGAAFNLQIRNATNTPTNWVMVWTGRPYQTIPALVVPAGVQYDGATPNGALWDHQFSSTIPLGAFQNATIAGAVPTPAGDNDCGAVQRFITSNVAPRVAARTDTTNSLTVTFTGDYVTIKSDIDVSVSLSGDVRDDPKVELKANKSKRRKLTGEGHGYISINGERFATP